MTFTKTWVAKLRLRLRVSGTWLRHPVDTHWDRFSVRVRDQTEVRRLVLCHGTHVDVCGYPCVIWVFAAQYDCTWRKEWRSGTSKRKKGWGVGYVILKTNEVIVHCRVRDETDRDTTFRESIVHRRRGQPKIQIFSYWSTPTSRPWSISTTVSVGPLGPHFAKSIFPRLFEQWDHRNWEWDSVESLVGNGRSEVSNRNGLYLGFLRWPFLLYQWFFFLDRKNSRSEIYDLSSFWLWHQLSSQRPLVRPWNSSSVRLSWLMLVFNVPLVFL